MSLLTSITGLVNGLINEASIEQVYVQRGNERKNLGIILRLIIDKFLDLHARNGKQVETETEELVDLLIVLEKILYHGFKPKTAISLNTIVDDLWGVVRLITKDDRDLNETYRTVCETEHLTSVITRVRAFLRMLAMKKELHYFFERAAAFDLLPFYESWAYLRSDDGQVLSQMLLVFKVFDCNLFLDDEVLNGMPCNVDLTNYIKPITFSLDSENHTEAEKERERNFQSIMAQKQYLEDENKKLKEQLTEHIKVKSIENFVEQEEKIEYLTRKLEDEKLSFSELTSQYCALKLDSERNEERLKAERIQCVDMLNNLKKHFASNVKTLPVSFVFLEKQFNETLVIQSGSINKINQKLEFLRKDLSGRSKRTEQEWQNLIIKMELKQTELFDLKREKEEFIRKIEDLEQQQKSARLAIQELAELRLAHAQTAQKLLEAEQALIDLGPQLSHSKLQVVMMKEQLLPTSEWVKDADVSSCVSCNAEFSVTLRKHHCRRCGQIFCDQCSSNRVHLPSHAKEVRVCCNCYSLLETLHSTTVT